MNFDIRVHSAFDMMYHQKMDIRSVITEDYIELTVLLENVCQNLGFRNIRFFF